MITPSCPDTISAENETLPSYWRQAWPKWIGLALALLPILAAYRLSLSAGQVFGLVLVLTASTGGIGFAYERVKRARTRGRKAEAVSSG
ncbi:hypothetical protein [Candidatus Poriferisodalis sp.]|uniref:hypothetical protein n=1 Tax=Candidatus Poriferisodalis sp. TaxID=3101277 RepID=UPI003B5CA51D